MKLLLAYRISGTSCLRCCNATPTYPISIHVICKISPTFSTLCTLPSSSNVQNHYESIRIAWCQDIGDNAISAIFDENNDDEEVVVPERREKKEKKKKDKKDKKDKKNKKDKDPWCIIAWKQVLLDWCLHVSSTVSGVT